MLVPDRETADVRDPRTILAYRPNEHYPAARAFAVACASKGKNHKLHVIANWQTYSITLRKIGRVCETPHPPSFDQ